MSLVCSMWKGFITFHLSQDWLTEWRRYSVGRHTGTLCKGSISRSPSPTPSLLQPNPCTFYFVIIFLFRFLPCFRYCLRRLITFFSWLHSFGPRCRLPSDCSRAKQMAGRKRGEIPIKMSGCERNKWHVKWCTVFAESGMRQRAQTCVNK